MAADTAQCARLWQHAEELRVKVMAKVKASDSCDADQTAIGNPIQSQPQGEKH